MNRIEVYRAGFRKRQWAFRFVAANGKKVAYGETYKHKIDAVSTADLVRRDFMNAEISVED